LAVWVGRHSDLNCRNCTEQMQGSRGCKGLEKALLIPEIDTYIERCPAGEITYLSIVYLELYSIYRDSSMRNRESWLEQSCKFTEAMKVIEKTVHQIEKHDKEARDAR
jgi:hypothetical protein